MKKTILLVDDQRLHLNSIGRVLENDFNVITARSIDKMYIELGIKRPSLIILDVTMPDEKGYNGEFAALGGLSALEKLKKSSEWATIPVLMITGFGEEYADVLINKILELGAIDIYFKNELIKHHLIRYPALLVHRVHNYCK